MSAELIPESKLSVQEHNDLRKRLDNFYSKVPDYLAFNSVSSQLHCWAHIKEQITVVLKKSPERIINILEVGAGRSGFGNFLEVNGLRKNVNWVIQDVTSQNSDWLDLQADKVFYGDIDTINLPDYFDIVFSTYVLEHVSNPQVHLNILFQFLNKTGVLFIFCPRYDMPGYLCPSCKHLSLLNKIGFGFKSTVSRLGSILLGKSNFLIQTDLAAFYGPFFLDSDAVHWVSKFDLKIWAKSKGTLFFNLTIGNPKFGTKDWIVKRYLTCAVKIVKV